MLVAFYITCRLFWCIICYPEVLHLFNLTSPRRNIPSVLQFLWYPIFFSVIYNAEPQSFLYLPILRPYLLSFALLLPPPLLFTGILNFLIFYKCHLVYLITLIPFILLHQIEFDYISSNRAVASTSRTLTETKSIHDTIVSKNRWDHLVRIVF